MTVLPFWAVLLLQGAGLSAIMCLAWLIHRKTRNAGWIDVTWTAGIGLTGAAAALIPLGAGEDWTRQLLVAVLIILWAARLATHISQRSAARGDDPRYADLVRQWGTSAPRQMFILLQKQAWVSWPLPVAVAIAAHRPGGGLSAQDGLAIAVFLIALAGEALADRQLRAFLSDPANKGKVCDAGLWRYSRHPNYFFEWMHWLTYPVIAIDLAGGFPTGWLAVLAPACMYWLLVHVSGVPPLEAHMLQKHGARYKAYQARTNIFFPGPVKHV